MTKEANTLGVLGGGQLGRMSAMAAQKLGIKTVIYCPDENSPAGQIADHTIIGKYDDRDQLAIFCDLIDVCSYEFENIPTDTLKVISKKCSVWPDTELLKISQHRVLEKKFLNDTGVDTAKWTAIDSLQKLVTILNETPQTDYILKTCRFGYDGKGQGFINKNNDIEEVYKALNSNDLILETCIDFDCEISVIIARDQFGKTVIYDPPLNLHKNHILHKSIVPAPLPENTLRQARDMGQKLAEKINLIGVMALELFVTKDGQLLGNEIAPRTHNSGHWTIDACKASQFENHVRAVCGLPVLEAGRHSDAEMINLIGDDVHGLNTYENNPNAHIHLYGKEEARPGRKMGHVTILK